MASPLLPRRDRSPTGIEDAQVEPGKRGSGRRAVRVGGVLGRHLGAGLGEPVGEEDRDAAGARPLDQTCRDRAAAHQHAAELPRLQAGVEALLEGPGHQAPVGDAVLAHRTHHRRGVEARLENQRRAVVRAAHRRAEAAHVKQRQVAEPPVAGPGEEVLRRGAGERIECADGEPRRLGAPGGAGGEEERPVRSGVRGAGVHRRRAGPRPSLERLRAWQDVTPLRVGEHQPGANPVALVPELRGSEANVEGHER